jgi:hypothetical protein
MGALHLLTHLAEITLAPRPRTRRRRCRHFPPPPQQPTDALPGSDEKIAVLEERARCRTALHHPRDARLRVAGFCALWRPSCGR